MHINTLEIINMALPQGCHLLCSLEIIHFLPVLRFLMGVTINCNTVTISSHPFLKYWRNLWLHPIPRVWCLISCQILLIWQQWWKWREGDVSLALNFLSYYCNGKGGTIIASLRSCKSSSGFSFLPPLLNLLHLYYLVNFSITLTGCGFGFVLKSPNSFYFVLTI